MAVRVIPVRRKNPQKPEEPKLFYMQTKSIGNVDREFLIQDMVRNTTLTKAEAASGIDYFFETIPRLLSLGFTVKLGTLGYFMITARSEGVLSLEVGGLHQVKELRLRFIPGKQMRAELEQMSIAYHPDWHF